MISNQDDMGALGSRTCCTGEANSCCDETRVENNHADYSEPGHLPPARSDGAKMFLPLSPRGVSTKEKSTPSAKSISAPCEEETNGADNSERGRVLNAPKDDGATRVVPLLSPRGASEPNQTTAIAAVAPPQDHPEGGMCAHAATKQEKKMTWGRHWIAKGFEALERELAECSGTYCVGDAVTLADICLVPQVYNANRFKVDMSRFPNIVRINAALEQLAAFKAAAPDQMPDAQ